jgi:hypothetical protein
MITEMSVRSIFPEVLGKSPLNIHHRSETTKEKQKVIIKFADEHSAALAVKRYKINKFTLQTWILESKGNSY